jgi:hypothetical protein
MFVPEEGVGSSQSIVKFNEHTRYNTKHICVACVADATLMFPEYACFFVAQPPAEKTLIQAHIKALNVT